MFDNLIVALCLPGQPKKTSAKPFILGFGPAGYESRRGSANIGSRDTDGDGTNDLDFNTIAGTQYINLSAPPVQPCLADFNDDGLVNFFDISAFIAAFNAQDPSADVAAPFGVFNFFDISTFIAAYNAGCP